MLDKVRKTICEQSLISSGDRIICAVSGGADSVALLLCLFELKNEFDFSLCAAHFNHCIRGVGADRDEEYVLSLCKKLGIECFTGRADVPAYARENGYTVEQAARILRYEFLNSLENDKIAVAHHMDDQAESVMLHITRGSGTSGIGGMRYRRDNIIRPLLGVRRKEIEFFLAERSVAYCTDETNFTDDGTRNKLRLNIIPEIERSINPRFTEALCAMADIVRTDDDYLFGIAKKELESCRKDEGYVRTHIATLDEPVRRRAIMLATKEAGAFADIEQKHILLIEGLLSAKTGAHLDLPHIYVYTSYDIIVFTEKVTAKADSLCVYPADEGCFSVGEFKLRITEVSGNKIHPDERTAYIDADKLPQNAYVRRRQDGDRISPVGLNGSKKVKDFFIDRKVSRKMREIPLICSENEVLCIVGYAVAKSISVDMNTKRMWRIELEEENG